MFLLAIKLKKEQMTDDRLNSHHQWFKKYFELGKFKIVGPFKDIENAGVILAQTENREEMEKIISEDAFYPEGAKYELHEFDPKLIAEDIK